MTRTTNARLAGITFLLYIAAGIASMALGKHPPARELLTLVTSFCALVLGVTLYALTREEDPDLALLALACRVVEAIPGHEGAIFSVSPPRRCSSSSFRCSAPSVRA